MEQVRQLIRTPLRGELSGPVPSQFAAAGMESVSDILSQVLRISSTATSSIFPSITVTPSKEETKATAPWGATASDAASAQSALLPFLIHLAASRDDVDGIKFCLETDEQLFQASSSDGSGASTMTVPGGVVNCLDASTQMSPLHVAALNGRQKAVEALLAAGALVHQRDVLDHTPLYYVSSDQECQSYSSSRDVGCPSRTR